MSRTPQIGSASCSSTARVRNSATLASSSRTSAGPSRNGRTRQRALPRSVLARPASACRMALHWRSCRLFAGMPWSCAGLKGCSSGMRPNTGARTGAQGAL